MRDARSGDYNLISFDDDQIKGKDKIGTNPIDGKDLFLRVDRWKNTPISIPVVGDPKNTEGKISWNLKPTLGAGGIRVQDLMVLHIIRESNWKFPIYFAVTVSPSNRLGLEKYLQMEGLAFRLRSHAVPSVNYQKLSENLMNVVDGDKWETNYSPGYKYRNLNNPDVYLNPNIQKLLQNYRSAFLQLGMERFRKLSESQKLSLFPSKSLDSLKYETLKPLNIMSELMPEDILPISSKEMTLQMGQIYHDAGDIEKGKTIFRKFHNSTRPDIVGFLLNIYKQNGYINESIDILQNWTETFPTDTNAIALLQRYLNEATSPES